MNFLDSRLPDRFWAKCIPEPNSGCWFWIACTDRDGYGRFLVDRIARTTHRIAYTALVGKIPHGLEIDHLCRNRCCCNPAHLEPVTKSENVKRGLSPAQIAALQTSKTHCPQGHPYSPENTTVWRNRRKCIACDRECSRRRYRARRERSRR